MTGRVSAEDAPHPTDTGGGYALPMRITTAAGESPNGSDTDLGAAFESVQRGKGEFLRVGRAGGEELQMLSLPIEHLEGGRIFRIARLPAVEALFRSFAAGTSGWDAGVEWVDVTDELRKQRREPWMNAVIYAGVLAFALLVGWLVLRRAG